MDVFLRLSPDQSQFFKGNSVSFSCEGSGLWTVRRNSSSRYNQLCSEFGDVQSDSSCEYPRLYPGDSGLYWCEREDISSEPVSITVRDRGILLQIPVRPVSVGDSVFLSCRRDSGPALPARFYRDGLLLSEQPAGHMSLQQVALSDSGLYQCESGGQRSESSRLRVHSGEKVSSSSPPPLWTSPSASPSSFPSASPSSFPSASPSSFPSPLLLSSIIGPVLLVLLVLLVVLVVLKRRRHRQRTERVEEGGADDITYSDIAHSQQRRPIRRPELESSPVYSAVKTPEVLYSDVTVRGGAPGKRGRGGASELESSPVYSAVKTPEVLYSHVTVRGGAPGGGARRGGASDPQVIYSSVRGKERKRGHKETRT